MGNTIFIEEGVVLKTWNYSDGTVIYYTKFPHTKVVILKHDNPNYDYIMNTLQTNKAYKFKIKNAFPLEDRLLDIDEPDVYKMVIKIEGFKDLSNNCKALNGMHQIICSNTGLDIITDIGVDNFIIGASYEIEYKMYGVNMLHLLLSYEKVKMV